MRGSLIFKTRIPMRERLDTECIAFRMSTLWGVAIERETIAKLNENFW
jgi:hypothetical protein